jgi:hypothetical protein
VGQLEERQGVKVLRASRVALSSPMAGLGLRRRVVASKQPDVVFTLPLAGVEAVPPNARLLVQFSDYMDEESFEGRVRLRYGDAAGPARDLPRLRWTYDDVRRTLVVEPGERLRAGATLELLLLPGITDAFDVPIGSPSEAADVPVRVLRWQVEGERERF